MILVVKHMQVNSQMAWAQNQQLLRRVVMWVSKELWIKSNDTKLNITNINKYEDLTETPSSTHHHFCQQIIFNVNIYTKVLPITSKTLNHSFFFVFFYKLQNCMQSFSFYFCFVCSRLSHLSFFGVSALWTVKISRNVFSYFWL